MDSISSRFFELRPWQFENENGTIFSKNFIFFSDGTIGGYSHPNEARWVFENQELTLMTHDGIATCVLQLDKSPDTSFIVFRGKYLLSEFTVFHLLRQPKPNIGCFMRIHFWDDNILHAYKLLSSAWNSEVILAADQTNEFDIPENIGFIPHSAFYFSKLGLPLYPSPKDTLWYNGDYVFYNLCFATDFDYFVVCEYDLVIKEDLRSLVNDFVFMGLDFVAPHAGKSPKTWTWFEPYRELISSKKNYYCNSTMDDLTVYQSFFPFVFISRRAALYLYQRRLALFNISRSSRNFMWPYCESFAPSELNNNGMYLANVMHYIDECSSVSYHNPIHCSEVLDKTTGMFHPVLNGPAFVNKLISHAKSLAATDPSLNIFSYLRTQANRCRTQEEMSLLDEFINTEDI